MRNNVEDHDIIYALGPLGKMVYIEDIPLDKRGLACGCLCPKCKKPLIAKFGHDVPHRKKPHFAHQKGSDCKGATMTALHKLAEEILEEEKTVMMPEYKIMPAKRWSFTSVESEQRNDRSDLQPDIVGVTADGSRWHIEIRNTSEVKDDKIRKLKDSCLTCLEIDVRGHEKDKKEELKEFLLNSVDGRKWINNSNYDKIISEFISKIQNGLFEVSSKYRKEDGYDIIRSNYCNNHCRYQGKCTYKKDSVAIEGIEFVVCCTESRKRDQEQSMHLHPSQKENVFKQESVTLSFGEIMDDSDDFFLYDVKGQSLDEINYHLNNERVVYFKNGSVGEILCCERTKCLDGIAVLFRSVDVDRVSPLQLVFVWVEDNRLRFNTINCSRDKDVNIAKTNYKKLLNCNKIDQVLLDNKLSKRNTLPF